MLRRDALARFGVNQIHSLALGPDLQHLARLRGDALAERPMISLPAKRVL